MIFVHLLLTTAGNDGRRDQVPSTHVYFALGTEQSTVITMSVCLSLFDSIISYFNFLNFNGDQLIYSYCNVITSCQTATKHWTLSENEILVKYM